MPLPPETIEPPQLPVYQSVVYPAPGLFTEMTDEAPIHIPAGYAFIPEGAGGTVTVTTTLWHLFE